MGERATTKNISRPTISQIVDLLEKKKLLMRSQRATDRQIVRLALTEEGNDLLDTVFKETREWMSARMSKLSADELENIGKAMEALRKILE